MKTGKDFNGHYYSMIPTGTQNQNGKNLYQFYNGYDNYTDKVGTYEDGVIIPGQARNVNIQLAIGIKK